MKNKNNIFGYCRISTPNQSIDRQVRNILKLFPNSIIIQEIYTGTSLDRPKFDSLLKVVKEGDTIVFDSVSRMSRNAKEGIELYFELFNKGINLIFLKEPLIDSNVYRQQLNQANNLPYTDDVIVGYYLEATRKTIEHLAKKQIELAFWQSEKEVLDMRLRTSEGLITAKLNGKQVGRYVGQKVETKKSKISKELILRHSKTFGGTLKDIEIMEMIKGKIGNINKETYYIYKKQLKSQFLEGNP